MSSYDYYAIDCNWLEKRLWEQNKFYTGLELELKATKAQFEDVSDYFKKKSYRVERPKMVIDHLIAAKTKTDIVLTLVENLIDTS